MGAERSDDDNAPRPVLELAFLLSQAERRLTRQLARAVDEHGSNMDEWRILSLLGDGDGHSMSELAEFTLRSPPSLTRLIDRAVADNLVYRKADPSDRRRVLVYITARGRAMRRRLEQRIKREHEAILTDAGATNLDQLESLLTDLIKLLP